jgi:hypothetical protein
MGFELRTVCFTAQRLFPEIVRPNAAVILADSVSSLLATCSIDAAVDSQSKITVREFAADRLRCYPCVFVAVALDGLLSRWRRPGADPLSEPFLDRPCGRGLFLMRSYMTWVSFNREGNRVTLCRQRSLDEQKT